MKEKKNRNYKIAVIPGDGTGPEVTAEAVKVLNACAGKNGFRLDLTHFDFGGERYLRTGETLPKGAVDELRKFDAIFLGAATYGGQRPDVGAYYGSRFTPSGYGLSVSGLSPGTYQLVVFGHSTVTDAFTNVRTVTVTVQ